jgi:hypothetical protein
MADELQSLGYRRLADGEEPRADETWWESDVASKGGDTGQIQLYIEGDANEVLPGDLDGWVKRQLQQLVERSDSLEELVDGSPYKVDP